MTVITPSAQYPYSFHGVKRPREEEKPLETMSTPLDDLPILAPPPERQKLDIDMALLQLQRTNVGLLEIDMNHHLARIDSIKKQKQEINAALILAIQERVERAKQSDGWSIFLKVATCLGSLLSIALGAAAIASGVGIAAGIAMIIAGTLGLGAQIASECKLWEKVADYFSGGDKQMKERIQWHLDFWVSITTLIASIVSMVFGGAAAAQNLLGTAGQVFQTGVTVTTGVGTLGKGIVDKYRYDNEADIKEIEGRLDRTKEELKDHMNFQKDTLARLEKWEKFEADILDSMHERTRLINDMR